MGYASENFEMFGSNELMNFANIYFEAITNWVSFNFLLYYRGFIELIELKIFFVSKTFGAAVGSPFAGVVIVGSPAGSFRVLVAIPVCNWILG